jgi:hypothetical protein
LRWITDPSLYNPVAEQAGPQPWTSAPYTVLSSADVRVMLDHGVIRRIAPADVRGPMRLFAVTEEAKRRRRPIRWTTLINDVLGRDTLIPLDMARKCDIIALVRTGSHAIAFDAKAFFDQFELHPDIGAHMCFKKGRNFFCATRAAMGQRQSVEVAHTTMQRIVQDPERECYSAVIIDNAIFVGDRDACVRDGKRFVERCRRVGCDLNENTGDIDALVTQQIEWGGVAFDFAKKTTRLTARMVDKIALSWSLRERWTLKGYVSHMGLLFWTLGLVCSCAADFFVALNFYAAVCCEFSIASARPDYDKKRFWSQPVFLPEPVLESIRAWTEQALRNVPRKVPKQLDRADMPDWLVCVDASREGFGYVAVAPRTGETRFFGEPWPDDFRRQHGMRLRQSVFTEPEAAVRSMCHLLSYDPNRVVNVHIWTDSVTTRSSINKGFNARSEHINEAVRRLRAIFPAPSADHSGGFVFTCAHIPGKDNVVADALSRGKRVTFSDIEGAAAQMHSMFGGEAASRDFAGV